MYQIFFDLDNVVVELENTEKFAAIHELLLKTSVFGQGEELKRFEDAVVARERLQSTGLGHGVAFAHGKLPEVVHMRVALGISRKGIVYDAVDGKPVHLLFLVATNPEMHIDYLRCLSRLASLVRHEGFRKELLGCFREEDICQKLSLAWKKLEALATAS